MSSAHLDHTDDTRPEQERSTRHVLVIGIDGVRYDTLRRLPTPGIDAIAEAGFLSPVRVNAAGPTISGPSWATVFTGVLADRHLIMNNNFDGHRLDQFPDLIRLAQQQRPGLPAFVGAAWLPLVSDYSGGPMFADGGYVPDLEIGGGAWDGLDEQVVGEAVRFIETHDSGHGSLVVCYLGSPDEVAHAEGAGQEYEEAIKASDARVVRLLEAIAARTDEEWTVIAVTDHGHVDEGGHGGDSDEERTAWMAASGPFVQGVGPGVVPDGLEQADVAAHAMATLQIDEPAWAYMTGRPFDAPRNRPDDSAVSAAVPR